MRSTHPVPEISLLLALALLLSTRALHSQSCPPQGSFLTTTPAGTTTVGTPFDVSISGPVGQPYIFFLDTTPGPIQVPGLGCVAVGISPAFHMVINGYRFPFAIIPPSGTATLHFMIPNDSNLIGLQTYFQAGVKAPTNNTPLLSNGTHLSIGTRPTRAYICDQWNNTQPIRIIDVARTGCPTTANPPTIPCATHGWRLTCHQPSGTLYVGPDPQWTGPRPIQIVDLNTNTCVGTIATGREVLHLAINSTGTTLYTLGKKPNDEWHVQRIDTGQRNVTHTWAPNPPVTGAPPQWENAEIILSHDDQRVYFSRPGGITILNATDLSFLATLLAPPQAEANGVFRGLAHRPQSNELWAAGTTGIWIVKTDTPFPYYIDHQGNPTSTPAYPIGSVQDLAFDETTGFAYANTANTSDLTRIDPRTATTTTYPTLLAPEIGKIAISPGGSYLIGTEATPLVQRQNPIVLQLGAIPTRACTLAQHFSGGGLGDILYW